MHVGFQHLPLVKHVIGLSAIMHRLCALLSLDLAPVASLDGVMIGKGNGCGGSAGFRLHLDGTYWLIVGAIRNTSASEHADPCMLHGLIAWLSCAKLRGATKSLTKSRNKLRQATAEVLTVNVSTLVVVHQLVNELEILTVPQGNWVNMAHDVALQWLRKRLTGLGRGRGYPASCQYGHI